MFIPTRDIIVRSLGFFVTAWTAGDTADPPVDVVLYDATWARIADTGATSGKLNATGAKSIAITPVTLRAGKVYYFGLGVGPLGTSTVTLAAVTPGSAQVNQAWGTTAGQLLCDAKVVYVPPDPWVFAGTSSVGFLGSVLEA
jgi:hypothetical protein